MECPSDAPGKVEPDGRPHPDGVGTRRRMHGRLDLSGEWSLMYAPQRVEEAARILDRSRSQPPPPPIPSGCHGRPEPGCKGPNRQGVPAKRDMGLPVLEPDPGSRTGIVIEQTSPCWGLPRQHTKPAGLLDERHAHQQGDPRRRPRPPGERVPDRWRNARAGAACKKIDCVVMPRGEVRREALSLQPVPVDDIPSLVRRKAAQPSVLRPQEGLPARRGSRGRGSTEIPARAAVPRPAHGSPSPPRHRAPHRARRADADGPRHPGSNALPDRRSPTRDLEHIRHHGSEMLDQRVQSEPRHARETKQHGAGSPASSFLDQGQRLAEGGGADSRDTRAAGHLRDERRRFPGPPRAQASSARRRRRALPRSGVGRPSVPPRRRSAAGPRPRVERPRPSHPSGHPTQGMRHAVVCAARSRQQREPCQGGIEPTPTRIEAGIDGGPAGGHAQGKQHGGPPQRVPMVLDGLPKSLWDGSPRSHTDEDRADQPTGVVRQGRQRVRERIRITRRFRRNQHRRPEGRVVCLDRRRRGPLVSTGGLRQLPLFVAFQSPLDPAVDGTVLAIDVHADVPEAADLIPVHTGLDVHMTASFA